MGIGFGNIFSGKTIELKTKEMNNTTIANNTINKNVYSPNLTNANNKSLNIESNNEKIIIKHMRMHMTCLAEIHTKDATGLSIQNSSQLKKNPNFPTDSRLVIST